MHNNIAWYRKALNLTQYALAQKLGVSQPLIYKWEKNYAQPSAGHKQQLIDILGVPDVHLFSQDQLNPQQVIKDMCHLI